MALDAGVRQRDIVGHRIAFDDGELLTKYTLPFVDATWRVAFLVFDRIGGPPRVFDGAVRVEGARLRAAGQMEALRPIESVPVDHLAALAHFDPWWAFRGVSGVDRRWIDAVIATNVARSFVREGRSLKVHDLEFSVDLRKLEALIAKDEAYRVVRLLPADIDLLTLRRGRSRASRGFGATANAKAL